VRKIGSVALLGLDRALQYEQLNDGLHIHLPLTAVGKYAYAFRIVME
jgi:alpha-L-fucosidase